MAEPNIKEIKVEFTEAELTKYGLFPLVATYLMKTMKLSEYFEILSVKRKRNNNHKRKSRKPKFNEIQMSMGLIAIILLGIPRLSKINDVLSTENKLAELLGLPSFFDQSTAHIFLRNFNKWHVEQLININNRLIQNFGYCPDQDVLVLDLDSQTISLESKKREKAVRGYNKKKRGKPCYQWNVVFCHGEIVSQLLRAGDTHGISCFTELITTTKKKFAKPVSIIRVDGAYLSGSIIEFIFQEGLQLVTTEKYNWIIAQPNVHIDPERWIEYDQDTRIYDLGIGEVLSTSKKKLRAILVEKKQRPSPGKRKKLKILRYAIVENLAFKLSPGELYNYYHQRQTIENFFKEGYGSFSSAKMPSQKFRANEAYLLYLSIAYNSFIWFKKNFYLQHGRALLSKFFEKK